MDCTWLLISGAAWRLLTTRKLYAFLPACLPASRVTVPRALRVQVCASVVLDMTGPNAVEWSVQEALQRVRGSLEGASTTDTQLTSSPYCTGRQLKPADPPPADIVSQIEGLTAPPPQGKLLSMAGRSYRD